MTEHREPDVFSRMYRQRGDPTADSPRARLRLGAYIDALKVSGFREHLKIEGGYKVPYRGAGDFFEYYFQSAVPFDVVLDTITLLYRFRKVWYDANRRYGADPDHINFRQFAEAVLTEENVAFTVDLDGHVHPIVDAAFAEQRASLIRGMDLAGLSSIRTEVEHCYEEMAKRLPRYKVAVRSMFEAVEIASKKITRDPRLNSSCANKIAKLLRTTFDDEAAQKSAVELGRGFAAWVNGAHHYRHGQVDDDSADAPPQLAVALVTQGASWLRLIVDQLGESIA